VRWKESKHEGPNYGDRRKVTRFLLLPKELAGEWRWLETASWLQVYVFIDYEDYRHWRWEDLTGTGWIDE
jgi:hypothetical protein